MEPELVFPECVPTNEEDHAENLESKGEQHVRFQPNLPSHRIRDTSAPSSEIPQFEYVSKSDDFKVMEEKVENGQGLQSMFENCCKKCLLPTMFHDMENEVLACQNCGYVAMESQLQNDVSFGKLADGSSYLEGTQLSNRDLLYGSSGPSKGFKLLGPEENKLNRIKTAQRKCSKKIDTICSTLNIPERYAHDINGMVEQLGEGFFTKQKFMDEMIACCCYIVSRQHQLPLTLADVADAVQIPIPKLGSKYKDLCSKLQIHLPVFDPTVLVDKFAYILKEELGKDKDEIVKCASKLLRVACSDSIATGRRPQAVAGAALKFASEAFGIDLKMKDISKIAGCGKPSLNERYKELSIIFDKHVSKFSLINTDNEKNRKSAKVMLLEYLDTIQKMQDNGLLDILSPVTTSSTPQHQQQEISTSTIPSSSSTSPVNVPSSSQSSTTTTTTTTSSQHKSSPIETIYIDSDGEEEIREETNPFTKQTVIVIDDVQQNPSTKTQDLLVKALTGNLKTDKVVSKRTELKKLEFAKLKEGFENAPRAFIRSQIMKQKRAEKVQQALQRLKSKFNPKMASTSSTQSELDSEDVLIEKLLLKGAKPTDLIEGNFTEPDTGPIVVDDSEDLTEKELTKEEEEAYIIPEEEAKMLQMLHMKFGKRKAELKEQKAAKKQKT